MPIATKSTASQEPRRNIAVKKGSSAPQQPPPISATVKRRDLETLQTSNKFLDNFNPQNSRREKNKRRNQYQVQQKATAKKTYNYTALYDDQGRLKSSGQDICDCFDAKCAGCHFPCYTCGSEKCAIRCRNNRKFMYEAVEHDGKDLVVHNPLLT